MENDKRQVITALNMLLLQMSFLEIQKLYNYAVGMHA